jgi:hypothetical protein
LIGTVLLSGFFNAVGIGGASLCWDSVRQDRRGILPPQLRASPLLCKMNPVSQFYVLSPRGDTIVSKECV